MELKKYKLGEIAEINQSTLNHKDSIKEILYLDTSSITDNEIFETQRLQIEEAPSRAQRKVKDKTILYSTVRPRLKHHGILSNPPANLIVSTGFATLDVKTQYKNLIDPTYLYLALTQPIINEYIANIADTAVSAYPSINPSDLSSLKLTFPDFINQKYLADVWHNLDKKIALNKQINDNLEAMAKQLYDYWFVQFDFPNGEGKPYKASGGKMVWNEKLKREIPEGWSASNICKIADILSGGTPSKSIAEYWDKGNIPFFGPTDCDGSMFQLDTSDHITGKGLNHCASSLFEDGDIIITARGSIGKLVIVGTPMAMNQSCYALRSNKREYEYLYFLTHQLIECLKAKGSGSVFKSIITSDIENSNLCIGDEKTITSYCQTVASMFAQIKSNQQEIAELTKQRDELLPLLMNGQATVN